MPKSRRGGWTRHAFALTLAAAGVAALARLVAISGASDVFAACRRAGFGAGLIAAAPAAGLLIHTLAWRTLLPASARPRLADSCRAFVAAQAGNDLGFGFLGEPFKVLSLAPSERSVGVSVVALDNLTSAIALVVFFGLVGAGAAAPGLAAHRAASLALLAALLCGAAVLVATSERARAVARTSVDLVAEHPLRAVLATGLHLLGKLWLVAEMALATALLDSPTLHGALVLALASATAAAVGSPVPGQVGVAEGALLGAASAAGLPPTTVLAIGLLRRARSTLWLVLGGFLGVRLLRLHDPLPPPERNPCTSSR
ncbi:MAG TPA: lysylphosphatidylglycerol synthase domain-containing protein [Polyangiaceae bacterium]|nr:lysylphosphatidylglycerol synthase domain-containing protein [Polyangiaceae bacterium]